MTKITGILVNDKLNPTFNDGQLVVVIKDCDDYCSIASEFNPFDQYFKKNSILGVINCGCSQYTRKNGVIEFIDDEEWCEVETIIEYAEDEFDDFRGVVRASHLRKCEFKELE